MWRKTSITQVFPNSCSPRAPERDSRRSRRPPKLPKQFAKQFADKLPNDCSGSRCSFGPSSADVGQLLANAVRQRWAPHTIVCDVRHQHPIPATLVLHNFGRCCPNSAKNWPKSRKHDQLWPNLARIERTSTKFGQRLPSVGRCWPKLAQIWQTLANVGGIWPIHGPMWANVGQCGPKRLAMGNKCPMLVELLLIRVDLGQDWRTPGQHRQEMAPLGPNLGSRSDFSEIVGQLLGQLV